MRTIIYGAPGAGKTTRLLSIVEDELRSGTPTEKIGYLAFTKKAATEAAERAKTKFGNQKFPFFCTIHSLAYSGAGIRSSQLFKDENWLELSKVLGLSVTGRSRLDDDNLSANKAIGDIMLFIDNLSRTSLKDLEEVYSRQKVQFNWHSQLRFSETYRKYKHQSGLVDFTDMLMRFNDLENFPKFTALFVDEAQDLSKLQWSIVEKLAERTDRFYVCGDDDQAIFRWAGADVDTFMNFQGEKQYLEQSYRVPASVHSLAKKIRERITVKIDKKWDPKKEQGEVQYISHLDAYDFSKEDILVLARNTTQLYTVMDHLKARGYLFSYKEGLSIPTKVISAVVDWERLRKGGSLFYKSIKNIYEHMDVGVGVSRGHKDLSKMNKESEYTLADLKREFGLITEDIWHKVLTKINFKIREYLIACLRRGEKLSKPRIRLSTIHGSKGGEARNVVLLTEMSPASYESYKKNNDDECRVFYVGITRAKHSLTIVRSPNSRGFPL